MIVKTLTVGTDLGKKEFKRMIHLMSVFRVSG